MNTESDEDDFGQEVEGITTLQEALIPVMFSINRIKPGSRDLAVANMLKEWGLPVPGQLDRIWQELASGADDDLINVIQDLSTNQAIKKSIEEPNERLHEHLLEALDMMTLEQDVKHYFDQYLSFDETEGATAIKILRDIIRFEQKPLEKPKPRKRQKNPLPPQKFIHTQLPPSPEPETNLTWTGENCGTTRLGKGCSPPNCCEKTESTA